MHILGIDPGYDRLGIAVIEYTNGKPKFVYSACFETDKKSPLTKRLFNVGEEIAHVIKKYKPELLAIETLFLTNNQKTAMGVAEARGVICYEASRAGVAIVEMSPLQIKQALTGFGRAEKTAVFEMTKRLIQVPERKMLDDEMDALAVAIAGSVYGVRGNVVVEKE
jgi:crossover junction endodeoxyribonuclease RuvC